MKKWCLARVLTAVAESCSGFKASGTGHSVSDLYCGALGRMVGAECITRGAAMKQ